MEKNIFRYFYKKNEKYLQMNLIINREIIITIKDASGNKFN